MFKIDTDKTIHVSRGDAFSIILTANNGEYVFEQNDIVRLRVYSKNGYKKEPVMEVVTTVESEESSVTITVPKEKTLFSGDINKPTTFWYEISLNEDTTIIGYDEDGAKLFIIYPAEEGE